jgi:hypothetical protein
VDLGLLVAIVSPAVSAVFAAGGAYAAVRVHLSYLRRGHDDHESRLRALERPDPGAAFRLGAVRARGGL